MGRGRERVGDIGGRVLGLLGGVGGVIGGCQGYHVCGEHQGQCSGKRNRCQAWSDVGDMSSWALVHH